MRKIVESKSLPRHLGNVFMAVFLLTSCVAKAADWKIIGDTINRSNGNVSAAVDVSSVEFDRLGRVSVWVKFTPMSPQERKYSLGKARIDCEEKTIAWEYTIVYGEDGTPYSRSSTLIMEPIAPDTMNDLISRYVCPRKGRK
jgi:hypothetical protein